jgi:hypothetical protein
VFDTAMMLVATLVLFSTVAAAPAPPPPHIAAGFATSNVFWPNEVSADGIVFACTYLPTLVRAGDHRLIAHGSCATDAKLCNGFHAPRPAAPVAPWAPPALGTNPISEGLLCQKHSDDGGRNWSTIRLVADGAQPGQVLWDAVRSVLIMHYSTSPPLPPTLLERRSHDLGETWSVPRDLGPLLKALGPAGDTAPPLRHNASVWSSPGHALQLSPTNAFHPGRIIFTGHINSCQSFWFSDDGFNFTLAQNTSAAGGGPFCPDVGIGETAMAETPDGGILTSSRNGAFHGPGKCDCRATLRSPDGGDTFGAVGFDAVLVEPECMATMVNGDIGGSSVLVGRPGPIFHANPGHGTDAESKSPPDGRASGTVRRSVDGGRTWEASVVLNGHDAYSYSCLAKMNASHVGLLWETVLPGSGVPASWSTNNVVFSLVPQNFSSSPPPTPAPAPAGCAIQLEQQISKTPCTAAADDFGCYAGNATMWVANGCRGVFKCNGVSGVQCNPCPPEPTPCPPFARQCDKPDCFVCKCAATVAE